MNLYQITHNHLRALDFLTDPETDIPEDAYRDTLEGLEGEFKDKAIAVASYFQNLKAEAEAIDEALRKMQARKKALENHAERMKLYLLGAMVDTGIDKISCPYFVLSVAKCPPSVEITDEAAIPEDLMRVKVIREPDKAAIKEAGGCSGARIVTDKKRLSVR